MSSLLTIFNTPYYKWGGIGLLALILAVVVWTVLDRRAKKVVATKGKISGDIKEPAPKFPCRVAEAKTRTIITKEIDIAKIRKSGTGRQWDYLGKEVYYLFRNKE